MAIASFSRAIFLNPNEPCYHYHLAEAYLDVYDFDSSIAYFKHLLRLLSKSNKKGLNTKFIQLRLGRVEYHWGLVLLDQKRFKQALVAWERAESLGVPRQACLTQRLVFPKFLKAY
jgi:tetratricopeptide (TPR) repeat protein